MQPQPISIDTAGAKVRLLYSPKTDAERYRRAVRVELAKSQLFFKSLPGSPPQHKILFVSKDGHKIRVENVEMVYNDMLICDFVSDSGADGPLYRDTVNGLHLEVLEYALHAYSAGAYSVGKGIGEEN